MAVLSMCVPIVTSCRCLCFLGVVVCVLWIRDAFGESRVEDV